MALRASKDGWQREAPASQVEQVNTQAGAILLPGVNTSLILRWSGEHSFGFHSMSEHR